jgi:hypothetical protein
LTNRQKRTTKAKRQEWKTDEPGDNATIPEPENATDEPMGDDSDCEEYEADCSDDDNYEESDSIDDDIEEILRMSMAATSEQGSDTRIFHMAATAARQRLIEVSRGKARLDVADVSALLTGHLLAADAQTATLDSYCADMVELCLGNHPEKAKIDIVVALRITQQLCRLRESNARDARKTADLLARLANPQRSFVKVIAVGAGQFDMERKG